MTRKGEIARRLLGRAGVAALIARIVDATGTHPGYANIMLVSHDYDVTAAIAVIRLELTRADD